MAYLWKPGKISSIKMANAIASVTANEDLSGEISGSSETYENIQAYAKSVTIAIPEGAVDKQDLLGVDSNGFQNAELEDKPFENGGISGTLVLHSVAVLEKFYYGTGTAATDTGATGTTFRPGILTSAGRPDVAICLTLDNGLSTTAKRKINFLLNNARITKLGDVKISGPDSHFEVEFTATCLPRDFYAQFLTGTA
jgi:hypothetical protein